MIAITKVGDLETLGLGGWGPVGIVQQILEGIYLTSGMPWWATIAATTVLFRVALFPFVIKSQRAAAQLGNLKPLILPIQEEMKAAQAIKNKEKQMAAFTKLQAIYKEANVNPLAGLWGLAQVPVFMSMFFGLKGMAELPVPGFSTGGALWFSDLSAMDPTYILPITAAGTMLVVMEYSMEAQASANAAQSQMIKSVMRPLLFFSIFFTGAMPAAVFAYWVTSNFLTLGQFFLLRDQRVKDYLGIPAIKGDASGPAKALSTGIARDGMLAVRPMNFGEAWGLAKDEAQRRKAVVDAAVKK
ncbi:hypothetical protein BCR33DRAFT_661124 [Rhizoclosmatium globosum]|uniref:Membrane insertase YidC/Oxa/ALB C-terminal domain-containing protein n=1 Tax=Rhizoclosmatium globosum TaxID=329046 RepID=A0A1Y2C4M0_9FUNG|nr:hypothetical protein BCR33DRAFT_661124 [Rhizoclosmatium globosum]|eukprot:ORY41982.1 hypothetical protein BCR33DRAFT_661124 [Rhizoclosmatium globosum]